MRSRELRAFVIGSTLYRGKSDTAELANVASLAMLSKR